MEVIILYLDIDTVKDWLSDLDYKKALKYYNEGYVEELSVFSENSIWKQDNIYLRLSWQEHKDNRCRRQFDIVCLY